MISISCDVSIVGTGPGGLHSAGLLSERGIEPLVLERDRKVTDSICGELVCEPVMRSAGISRDSDIVANEISNTRVINRDTGREIEIPQKSAGKAFLLDENRFQTYLKEIAESNGAMFRFREKVISVLKNDGYVTGVRTTKGTYESSLTVGADGACSQIAETAGFPLSEFNALPSFRYKLEGCKDLDPDVAEFHLSKKIGLGYLWMYPRSKTECNVGIGSVRPSQMGTILKRFISEREALEDARIYDKNGAKIPYSGLLSRFTGNGVVLVGNSAGQVSSLMGGGVGTTLTGAESSVPVLIDSLESEDFSRSQLGRYEDNYRSSWAGRRVQSTARYLSKLRKFSEKNDAFSYVDEVLKIVDKERITETLSGNFSFSYLISLLLKHPIFVFKVLKGYYL